ncbi:MAG: histidine kinase, partial [Thiohalomonadaceae bacterium]
MTATAMHYLPRIDAGSLDELLVEWKGSHPGMGILVLLPEQEKAAVSTLQAVCARREVPLAGALFPAIMVDAEFRSEGAWV